MGLSPPRPVCSNTTALFAVVSYSHRGIYFSSRQTRHPLYSPDRRAKRSNLVLKIEVHIVSYGRHSVSCILIEKYRINKKIEENLNQKREIFCLKGSNFFLTYRQFGEIYCEFMEENGLFLFSRKTKSALSVSKYYKVLTQLYQSSN